MPYNRDTLAAQADKLSGIEEETDLYEGFSPHVDTSEIKSLDFYTQKPSTGQAHQYILVLLKRKVYLAAKMLDSYKPSQRSNDHLKISDD
ncbi:unnamed protein product [Ceratitis capitata]|uniref:(Mediterranean fruit fly) hypothetical protein n=1 Tax=Ceratitis capitata TaxID=7213 RepID=A0A811UL33_CERCA|nr:unnamed protein product [Ceratitis capitata]